MEPVNRPVILQPAPDTTGNPEPTDKVQQVSDFSVITLGTGGPIFNPKRSGPSTLVRYKENYFLVDMGNGTQARLSEAGITIGQLGTLMFTHHHIDHNEEFIPLFIQSWLRRGNDVTIIGPAGTKELYDFAAKFYKDDIAYRSSRSGREPEANITMKVRELTGDNSLELNGVSIRTAQVVHTILTIAYRFDAGRRSIVISGDTAYSENLVELAKGADILVMDSGGVIMKGNPQSNQRTPLQPRPAQINKENPIRAHSTLQEIAAMAEKAQVKRLVLTHFGPGEVDKDATSTAMKTLYGGTIIFAEDLMEIDCP